MKAKSIVIKGYELSEKGFSVLNDSSIKLKNPFEIERFDAIIPDQVDELMIEYELLWTWPWKGVEWNEKAKIEMRSYGTANPKRRMACGLSHFLLWKESMDTNEPILILEHDALFMNRFDPENALKSQYLAIGINDPQRATRLWETFHRKVQEYKPDEYDCVPCPTIDKMEVAQGLAGASAYIIKPEGAKQLWDALYEYGCWPNDAILCQQLFPWLGVTKQYYTRVQGLSSTTSSII